MKSFTRALILALAFATGNAGSTPSVTMSLKQSKIGGGMNMDSLSADIQVESNVSDDLTVGANIDNSDSKLKSIFARIKQNNIKADLSMTMADNSVSGDVTYTEGDNNIAARVNSGVDKFIESVTYSRAGAGWTFKPSYNMQDKKMNLEASADYSADTNIAVSVNGAGEGNLLVNHKLSADTNVKVSGAGLNLDDLSAEVSHQVDADTSLSVTGINSKMDALKASVARQLDADTKVNADYDMASSHATVGMSRKIDGGRTLNVNVDPQNSVKIEVAGASDEDWTASVSSPWGDMANADLSVGRKFNF